MKYYVKPTQEKQPAQISIHVGTNDLPSNKNSDEIAKEIVEFANSVTRKSNAVASSIVSRKDRFNNEGKKYKNLQDKCEEHDLQLMQRHNINPLRHTSAKGLHLNIYGDRLN